MTADREKIREPKLDDAEQRSGETDGKDPEAILRKHPGLSKELKDLFRNLVDPPTPSDGSETDERRQGHEGSDRLGDFRLIRDLGSGGMGTVYEAEQISLKRRVALKLLPSHLNLSAKAIQQFFREAEACGRQNHPGIISVYAVGEEKGIHYIAYELVEGGSDLTESLAKLRKEETLPLGYFRKAAKLIAEMADALDHAHRSGVIHRDVKPSNILITRGGHPKLTDFGLARVEGSLSLSKTGELIGTCYYMSPEQATGRRDAIDHRTDIYGLGVTLFEVLTLQRPFTGRSHQEVARKILIQELGDPRKVNPRVPRDLAVICLKAMERAPKHRYQTMAEFHDDLYRFLNGEVILARPASLAVRSWKRIRRNPALSIVAGLALIAFLALVLYGLWSYPTILSERNRALAAEQNAAIQARKARAVNEFLQQVIASPDPLRDGREVKVVDVLDNAAREAQRLLPGNDEFEAYLRNTLGKTYQALGLIPTAEKQLFAALELSRSALGEEHPDTLAAMNNLAVVLREKGEAADSEKLHRKALQLAKELYGEEHPQTLQVMNDLAVAIGHQDRLTEAEAIHRQVLEARRSVLGPTDRGIFQSLNNLAVNLLAQKRLDEAEQHFRSLLDHYGEAHTADPDRLAALQNLARVLTDRKDLEGATKAAQEALTLCTVVFGEDHPRTLGTRSNLGLILRSQDRLEEAEPLYRKVLESCRKSLGKGHVDTLVTMNNLADILTKLERPDEAADLLREAMEVTDGAYPEGHILRSMFQTLYGVSLVRLGLFEEAETHLLLGYKRIQTVKEAKAENIQNALRDLITLYEVWEKPDQAERYRVLLSDEL